MPVPARYTFLDDRFANGGMSQARVYTDSHLERMVVVKSLLPGRDRRRLLDEIAALQGVRSNHVVQIFDVCRDEGGEVEGIIEELVGGPQFGENPSPASSEEFLALIFPLAAGIEEIHAAGVIHRDIKPSNIKFDEEGCLKIFDFGLARGADAEAHTRGAVGSVGYMAPELYYDYAGGMVYFTSAVDVYAFAVTALYSCLKRVPRPLRRQPPILPCDEADFTKLPFALPRDVADILNSCLDPNPRDRPEMVDVRIVIGRHLLRDKHRALLAYTGRTYNLDHNNRRVKLSASSGESIDVRYDGLDFIVSAVSGPIFINNKAAVAGSCLPGSCVIAMGDPARPTSRTFITVDVAHPEVAV